MFDILLINPPVVNPGKIKKIRAVSPPLGLLSLAAYLESKDVSVKVLDLALEPELYGSLKRRLDNPRPLIGITSTTNTIGSALGIAKLLKDNNPDAFIVFGGPHPTILPEDVLKSDQVDCVVLGEGEFILHNLFLSFKQGKEWQATDGIAFRNAKGVVINSHHGYIEDLDAVPFPARHLVPFEKYKSSPINHKRYPSTPVITSRGCPFKCTFCSNPVHGKTVRSRSAENIIEELRLLQKKFGIRDVVFWDDTFTLNKRRVESVCRLMLKEKLDLTWSCSARVDTISMELLQIMKEAGCWLVSFGIESGVDRLRKKIHKGITEEQIFRAFGYCKKTGIETRAFFMLGLPTETAEESMQTVDFAKKLNPDFLQFTLTVPYPGSDLYREALSDGWKPPDWERFQTYPEDRPVYVPSGRDGRELSELQNKAFKSTHFRPSYIFKRLSKIRSFAELKEHIKVFFNMIRW